MGCLARGTVPADALMRKWRRQWGLIRDEQDGPLRTQGQGTLPHSTPPTLSPSPATSLRQLCSTLRGPNPRNWL
jgi:hypothetical protein